MSGGLFAASSHKFAHITKPDVPLVEKGVTTFSSGCSSYQPFSHVPFSPQQGYAFNNSLALWMINACLYTYTQFCDPKQLSFPPDIKNSKPLYWHDPFSRKPILCGFIAQITSQDPINRIIIALRGTDNLNEWIANLNTKQITLHAAPLNKELHVHSGFWNTFSKNTNSLQDQIHTYLDKTHPNELYITGHSLGAAVATLIFLDSALRYPELKITSYTIGSPRVGGLSLAQLADTLAKQQKDKFVSWRIANTEDIITTIPLPFSKDYLYTHLPHTLSEYSSTLSVTNNLGNHVDNHHPVTYYNAIKNLSTNKG